MALKHSAVPSSATLGKAKADVESAAKLWVRYDGEPCGLVNALCVVKPSNRKD